MQLGYFQVIALPVSTWVQLTFERSPLHSARLVTKLKMPPLPSASPGYQFWTVEYFTSASSCATDLDHRGVQLVLVAHRRGAAFEVGDVAALVGDDQGALELAGVLGIDAEIGADSSIGQRTPSGM